MVSAVITGRPKHVYVVGGGTRHTPGGETPLPNLPNLGQKKDFFWGGDVPDVAADNTKISWQIRAIPNKVYVLHVLHINE